MELVVVRDGYREIFVEKSCIKEIVLNPRIYEVPGAPQDVRGILFYEGLPVVIRRIGDGAPVCGIIMDGWMPAIPLGNCRRAGRRGSHPCRRTGPCDASLMTSAL